jgi:anthranilate synthase component I
MPSRRVAVPRPTQLFLVQTSKAPPVIWANIMTEIEFKALADQGFNRIPLLAECLSDLETPLSVYLKLVDKDRRANSFLLESVVGGERFGRYSFIGLPARTQVRADGSKISVLKDGAVVETHQGDPLDFVRAFKARYKAATRPGLPRFCGGLAGYFGYDLVRFIEPKLGPSTKPDLIGTPDLLLMVTEELAIVDNLRGVLYLLVYADSAAPEGFSIAKKRLRELVLRLTNPAVEAPPPPSSETPIIRHFEKSSFLAAAEKAREYIIAGDLMQVQVGQLIQKKFPHSPLAFYRSLRAVNPSPYMYYYDFGDFQVVGASPEILVRQESIESSAGQNTKITIRPLAGTRKRGASPAQDKALADELLADPKERAEHLMLIDLARNDIGRIAVIGSVKVTETMAIEKYSHVQHIVSNVEGVLPSSVDAIDVLRATFPAGTLTGAPKVRAMELIDELEITKRGIYGGACGYLSYSGEMDVAIAIRTAVIKDGQLFTQAAAGVVYDSSPLAEWLETEAKVRAVIRAAELVEEGLGGVNAVNA